MKPTQLLKSQHREVKRLFKEATTGSNADDRRGLLDEIAEKLRLHAAIEEEIFYPAVRDLGTKKATDEVDEALEEHHVVKLVLNELPEIDPDGERFEAKMTVLSELVEHHVQEEESSMFKLADKLDPDRLEALAQEMAERTGGRSAEPGRRSRAAHA